LETFFFKERIVTVTWHAANDNLMALIGAAARESGCTVICLCNPPMTTSQQYGTFSFPFFLKEEYQSLMVFLEAKGSED
jgi:hypothetical protein